jgi:3-oxo-5,6-didehydrosuberyl-CoA/3-oxoadipyl-CoA thiolase
MEELYGVDEMGCTAENLVEQYEISREDQDRFALGSQLKAERARSSGRFEREIVAVPVPQRKGDPVRFREDEFIREGSTIDGLARLRPVFRMDGRGSVTAGNSSGLNDGACVLLVGNVSVASSLGTRPRARFVASAVVGVEPRVMGIGPVEASKRALAKAGLTLADMDVIELNEAFAAQSLAVLRELGVADNDERVNPNGGAIALGHPLGMTGARLLLTAMIELEQRAARYALCTLCVGVGQGMATIIERVS